MTKICNSPINRNSQPGKLAQLNKSVTETPFKYNGRQLYKRPKYCFNVDWFSCTTAGRIVDAFDVEPPELLLDGGNVRLVSLGSGTKHYRFRYEVYIGDDAHPFAVIATAPRNDKILSAHFSQLTVKNHELYRRGWTGKLNYLLSALQVEINNVTRLDVACDGAGFFSFLENAGRGLYKQVGRARFSVHSSNGKAEYYDWGSSGASKFLRIYNKSKSFERENKQYIRDAWQSAGLQVDGDVERLELRMKSDALKRLVNDAEIDEETGEVKTGVNISRLEDADYLAGVMQAQFKRWFEFVLPTDSNISRCPRVSPIDWNKVKTEQVTRLTTTKPANETWQAKRFVSKALKEDGAEYVADAVCQHFGTRRQDLFTEDARRSGIEAAKKALREVFPYAIPENAVETALNAMCEAMTGGIDKDATNGLLTVVALEMAKQHGCAHWAQRKLEERNRDAMRGAPSPASGRRQRKPRERVPVSVGK